jgi:RHS repeat-associated protein
VFSNLTSAGFTGHESDGELGLVNMKGRIFDPKIGRFLTMDPVIQTPLSGQSWNPYSYVFNNPLSFVDPSGFDGEKEPIYPIRQEVVTQKDKSIDLTLTYPPREKPKAAPEQTGAYVPPVDVSTLGSGSGVLPSPAAFVPPDWDKDPFVQGVGGFLGGLCLGAVPFAGVGQQFLDAAEVLPHGTPEARLGLALGEIAGGLFTAASGLAGEVGGGALSVTGVGALAGVPVIVASTTAVVGGVGNVMVGIQGLKSTGAGTGGAKRGPKTDPDAPHNAKIRAEADALRAQGNKILAGGGSRPERLRGTPNGAKSGRRPDIIYQTPNGELRGRNVGRTRADGSPVPREQEALDDLNGPGGLPTDFVPYDR